MTVPRLELLNVTKRYPGVVANDDISLSVAPGERHALIGENGAGKSTLVKIVYGVASTDSGRILLDGRPVAIPNPRAARALGIGMVFQHFSLFDALTVFENIALGLDGRQGRRELAGRIDAVLRAYSLPLDLDRTVATLSVGERQRIEIVRCLLARPRLLIMDEPTSVLTPQEAGRLFEMLRRLSDEGCAILYISHKLGEIEALCERATILRAGRVVARCDPRAETASRMAAHMIGAELRRVTRTDGVAESAAAPRLAVRGLTLPRAGPYSTALRDIAFEVRPGEILGVAGVAGNGQPELLAALSGERLTADPDAIAIDGRPVGGASPGERRRLGLCCVPEERNGHATVPELSLAENTVLTARFRLPLASRGVIDGRRTRGFAGQVIERLSVKARGPGAAARSLSGGNLQKFILGREIGQDPGVLVVSQPTWGVDAGAAAAIHDAILHLARQGSAVVLISQDLDELLALSDRLVVLNEGRLSRAYDAAEATPERIGLLMGGLHDAPAEPGAPAHA